MKRALQVIAVFILILVVAVFGLKDTIIKNVLEKELTKSIGTNVRIYGVDYSVFKEKLDLKGIGIESLENDAVDIVQIGKISTKLNYKELFNKKVRLNRVDIKDIALNVKTNRKNVKKPLLNARQEIVKSNSVKLSQEDINKISKIVVNNYDYLIKNSKIDTDKFNQTKKIFLNTTIPLLDKYVDYRIEEIADEYIYKIIKQYRSLSNNIQMSLKATQDLDWKIEVGLVNISTKLLGREFRGTISEFSTDKSRMNTPINFVLDSLNGKETGRVSGNINLYKMKGKIKTNIKNVNIDEVKEVAPYVDGLVFLNQEIALNGDIIGISGKLQLKDIELDKENISEKVLGDKKAIDNIMENPETKLGDMSISYAYNPATRKVMIDSDVVEEIGVYLGADVLALKKVEQKIKDTYNKEIKKVKKELQSKLEGFFNSL